MEGQETVVAPVVEGNASELEAGINSGEIKIVKEGGQSQVATPPVETPAPSGVETPQGTPPATNPPEVGAEGGQASPKPEDNGQQPPETELDYGSILDNLSKETGVENLSVGKVKEAVILSQQIKADPYYNLPEGLRKAAEFQESGGDLKQYFEYQNKDVEGMDEKTLLFEKFKLDNRSMFAQDKDLGNRRFESLFKEKYGASGLQAPEESEEFTKEDGEKWKAENAEGIQSATDALKWDASVAKETLAGEIAKLVTPEGGANFTDDEKQTILEEHGKQVNATLSSFKGVEIKMPNDKAYTLGLGDEAGKDVATLLNDPEKYLDMVGLNDDGFDHQKMARVATILRAFEGTEGGQRLAEFIAGNYNQEFLENQIDNVPVKPTPEAGQGGAVGENSQWDEVAKKFVAQREQKEHARKLGN